MLCIHSSSASVGKVRHTPGTGAGAEDGVRRGRRNSRVRGEAGQVNTSVHSGGRYSTISAEGPPDHGEGRDLVPEREGSLNDVTCARLTVYGTEDSWELGAAWCPGSTGGPRPLSFSSTKPTCSPGRCAEQLRFGKHFAMAKPCTHDGRDLMPRSEPLSTRVDNLEFQS